MQQVGALAQPAVVHGDTEQQRLAGLEERVLSLLSLLLLSLLFSSVSPGWRSGSYRRRDVDVSRTRAVDGTASLAPRAAHPLSRAGALLEPTSLPRLAPALLCARRRRALRVTRYRA